MIEVQKPEEKYIIAGVCENGAGDIEASLDELGELVATAGGIVVSRVVQNLEKVHPGTYFGTGKLEEIREELERTGADGIVCDDELTPAQMRNMSDALNTKVLDRTLVILDIFAGHAVTREGRIQVELAQLKYRATRLTGMGRVLSRLGGGIGTRGPGETKLEVDRRQIHERISRLKAELKEIEKHRELNRRQREKNGMFVAAIVGYTNAGKSTLLNRLTDAGVLEEDKVFATLDPTTRSLTLTEGEEILLTDTVGFINKLPHHLVEAFHSTLEEARYADILLHVVDASNPQMERQMHVVYETLRELEVGDRQVITLFNKCDRPDAVRGLRDFQADDSLSVSAATGEGLEELKAKLSRILRERRVYLEKTYSYAEAGKIQYIRKCGQLLSEEYLPDGILVKAYVPAEDYFRVL